MTEIKNETISINLKFGIDSYAYKYVLCLFYLYVMSNDCVYTILFNALSMLSKKRATSTTNKDIYPYPIYALI